MKVEANFTQAVQAGLKIVEELMRRQADNYHPDIANALEIILEAGGKRIRPILALLVGKMFQADLEPLITLSAAVELLHTATLVHDDLIDGALLRRGAPTLNSHWSPGATVLTGDFLFARAARLAAETNSDRLTKLFAQTLAVIVNGEITQMFDSRCQLDKESYFKRIYAKTASLIETTSTGASIISKVSEEAIEQMRQFGYALGMAFQIIDDILDFTGEQVKLGKPVGSDLRQGLVTLPVIYYIEEHVDDPVIEPLLDGKCLDEDVVEGFVVKVRSSSAIHQAHTVARSFINDALNVLKEQPVGIPRNSLENLAFYIVERDL